MEKEDTSQDAPTASAADNWLNAEPLVLASASPRRAEILRAIGWPFSVAAANIDETPHAGEEPTMYVERLARAKAEAVARALTFGLVLGADTVVVLDGEILGKPRDEADATRMLRALRGRWHEVLTGVSLVRAGGRLFNASPSRTNARACVSPP